MLGGNDNPTVKAYTSQIVIHVFAPDPEMSAWKLRGQHEFFAHPFMVAEGHQTFEIELLLT